MGTSRITFLLALGTTLLASSADMAERPKAKSEAGATVTVVAEATEVELARTPNPVKVIEAEAIQESGADDLSEALPLLLPGQIQSYGGPGTGTNLYLGGGRTQDVVVLLDGIRITDPASANPSYADFSMGGVGRVEVLQGPASTRYGSDTHGGAIAMYSAGPGKEGLSGTASLGAGNRGVRRAEVSPAYGWAGGWLRAGLSANQEEQSIPADEPFHSHTGFLNFGQSVGEDGLLTLAYRNHYRYTPLPFSSQYLPPTWAYSPVFDASRNDTERDEFYIGSYRQALGADWLLETSFGHVTEDRIEPGMDASFPDDHCHGQRNQAVGTLTWTRFEHFHASLMLDHMAESAEISGDRSTATHDAVALELSREWDNGLRALASGRYQKDELDYTYASGASLPRRDSHKFVYKTGLNWLSPVGLRLYASYGTSYNTPGLYSLTHNLSSGYGDLGNELSHGGQVGATWERGPWALKLEASRTLYDQVINYVDLGYPDYKYENGTNLRVQGVEASVAYAGGTWRLEGFARSQEARNMSQPEDKQLTTSGAAGRPFFTGGLRGSIDWGVWRLAGHWSYTGSSYQYFDLLGRIDGMRTHFNDVGMSLAWTPSEAWALTLRGEHLLQHTYSREEWLSGELFRKNDAYLLPLFPAAGPTFSLDVKYSF